MFEIIEKKSQIVIRLTAGDSAEITTTPFRDTNNDGLYNPEDYDEPIVLDENGYVMFIIASPSGRIYVKKFLTVNNYNDNGELVMTFEPSDTKNLQPYRYLFSFTYFPNKTEQAYTYSTGIFEILQSLGNVDTLDEYLNPPIIEPDTPTDPTIPDETDPTEPDTPNTDNGDDTDDNTDSTENGTGTNGDDNTDDTGGDVDGNG